MIRDSTAAKGDGNGTNNIFFSDNIYGDTFGSRTLAVTTAWVRGGTTYVLRSPKLLEGNRYKASRACSYLTHRSTYFRMPEIRHLSEPYFR